MSNFTPPPALLNDSHLQQINTALDAIKWVHQQIDLAARAGIDLSSQKQQASDTEQRLRAIKQVYFPGR